VAALMLSERLRAELKGKGIRVGAVCAPGGGPRHGPGPDEVAKRIVAAVRADRAVVPVTAGARLGRAAYRVCPRLVRRLALRG
jgi:NAD(P)-dependent dehydrogenase (short-subunit alcohol dehydrogenase family)